MKCPHGHMAGRDCDTQPECDGCEESIYTECAEMRVAQHQTGFKAVAPQRPTGFSLTLGGVTFTMDELKDGDEIVMMCDGWVFVNADGIGRMAEKHGGIKYVFKFSA